MTVKVGFGAQSPQVKNVQNATYFGYAPCSNQANDVVLLTLASTLCMDASCMVEPALLPPCTDCSSYSGVPTEGMAITITGRNTTANDVREHALSMHACDRCADDQFLGSASDTCGVEVGDAVAVPGTDVLVGLVTRARKVGCAAAHNDVTILNLGALVSDIKEEIANHPEAVYTTLAPTTEYTETMAPTTEYTETTAPSTAYTETTAPSTVYTVTTAPSTVYTETTAPSTAYTETTAPTTEYTETTAPSTAYTETTAPSTVYTETMKVPNDGIYTPTASNDPSLTSVMDLESDHKLLISGAARHVFLIAIFALL